MSLQESMTNGYYLLTWFHKSKDKSRSGSKKIKARILVSWKWLKMTLRKYPEPLKREEFLKVKMHESIPRHVQLLSEEEEEEEEKQKIIYTILQLYATIHQ